MTSKAKEALDELSFNFHYEAPFFVASLASPRISDKGMHTIRRALIILAAIEGGKLKRNPPSNPESYDEWCADTETQAYDAGFNYCLDQLKRMGGEE